MAKKISELVELTAIATNDVFPVLDISANTTKKITWDNLVEDNFITAPKLATNAITLGYASTASNTTAGASVVSITAIAQTVTIPAGGRRVRISLYCPGGYNDSVANTIFYIYSGVIGSGGTELQRGTFTAAGGNYASPINVSFTEIPSAGPRTYNFGLNTTAGTGGTIIGGGTVYSLIETI